MSQSSQRCRPIGEVYPGLKGGLFEALGVDAVNVPADGVCGEGERCEGCIDAHPYGAVVTTALAADEDPEVALVDSGALGEIGLEALSFAKAMGLPWLELMRLVESPVALRELSEVAQRYGAEKSRDFYSPIAQLGLLEHIMRDKIAGYVEGQLKARKSFVIGPKQDLAPEFWFWSHFFDESYIVPLLNDPDSPLWANFAPSGREVFLDYHFDTVLGRSTPGQNSAAVDVELRKRYGCTSSQLKQHRKDAYMLIVQHISATERKHGENMVLTPQAAAMIAGLPLRTATRMLSACGNNVLFWDPVYEIFRRSQIMTLSDLSERWPSVEQKVSSLYPDALTAVGILLENYDRNLKPFLK